MAKILGESARYVTKHSIKLHQKQVLVIFIVFWGLAFIDGYLFGQRMLPYALILVILFSIVAILTMKWINKKIEEFEKERINFRKGAVGEAVIGYILETFPDDYCVVHDITTHSGNIDHAVVGPSGVYVIDAKNWKGVVSADGKGELLLNGKATDKQEVKILTKRVMSIKGKIKALSSLEPYVQGILAFPSARVEANWGTTGAIHCVREEQLYEHIVDRKKDKKLSDKEIKSIAKAFTALARTDKDFE